MFLIQNIIDNFTLVKNDFISWKLDPQVFIQFIYSLLISLSLIILFYLVGKKIRKAFFSENKKYTFYIDILLGYVITGTGIGLLGVTSLFRAEFIIGYIFLLLLIGLFPFSLSKANIKKLTNYLKKIKQKVFKRHNLIVYGVMLFIAISFLRLLTPEIGEDGYHTDYPRLYLSWQTTIHESREVQHVLSYPQLPEMIYTVPIILGDKEAVRFLHFYFYLLIIFLLFSVAREKKYNFAIFTPLLFVTAPAVIKYAPTTFTDFFALFPFVLAVLLIKKGMTYRNIILAGVCFGAVLSAKLWLLVYLPLLLVYLVILNRHLHMKQLTKMVIIFIVSYISVTFLWYIRSNIIIGNPIYPLLNQRINTEIYPFPTTVFLDYIGFNYKMFDIKNLSVLSPIFFFGVLLFLLNFRKTIATVSKLPLFLFASLFTLEQLFTSVSWGRYLLTWYIFASIIISASILFAYEKNKLVKFTIFSLYSIIFFYYATNTILLLPYGTGMADKDHYLTRILYRQNGNYYDFDNLFEKHIQKTDLVGTYGLVNFYYANFSYLDVGYVFDKKNTSFELLQKSHVTKLLIFGGDMKWFCKKLSLKNCNSKKYKLLAKYPEGSGVFNLYELKY